MDPIPQLIGTVLYPLKEKYAWSFEQKNRNVESLVSLSFVFVTSRPDGMKEENNCSSKIS